MDSTKTRRELYDYLVSLKLSDEEIDKIMSYVNEIHLLIESENSDFFNS